jgi:ATP-dependent Clp protease ATP-binding subunit ClpB
MTSNIGSEYILEADKDYESKVMQELQKSFRPEFLNRIDEIVMFNALSKDTLNDIVDKIMGEVESRLSDKHISIKLSEKAKQYILDNSYDPMYGARPVRRFISKRVETTIARAIIDDKIKSNSEILIDLVDDKFVIRG